MGSVYIFRGKAATGKTTLANKLASELSIPVFCKDDIVDAMKSSINIDKSSINNEVCYNILYKLIQTNLDLATDFVIDVALGDRKNADWFFSRFDYKDNIITKFFIDCSDENEWINRHRKRIENPLLHQSFKSIEHVKEYYENAEISPFNDEYIIDTSNSIEESFNEIINIIKAV